MPTIEEKNLAFDFPPDWYAVKYDHDAELIIANSQTIKPRLASGRISFYEPVFA